MISGRTWQGTDWQWVFLNIFFKFEFRTLHFILFKEKFLFHYFLIRLDSYLNLGIDLFSPEEGFRGLWPGEEGMHRHSDGGHHPRHVGPPGQRRRAQRNHRWGGCWRSVPTCNFSHGKFYRQKDYFLIISIIFLAEQIENTYYYYHSVF